MMLLNSVPKSPERDSRPKPDETRRGGMGSAIPRGRSAFILAAVLRSGARLRKLHNIEREDHLSDRLRDLLEGDTGFSLALLNCFVKYRYMIENGRSKSSWVDRT